MTNFRQVRMDDHWKKAFKRSYPLVLKDMEFSEGEVFGEVKLSLNPGVNAIVGKNGVGKSNFIRAIYNSLKSDSSNRERFSNLIDESKIKLGFALDENEFSVVLDPVKDNAIAEDILCLLFDPCTLIPEIQKLFKTQENLDELLESFSAVELSNDELKLAKFITNTEYSEIKIISIEDEYESFPMLPYFIVDRQGIKYDSRDMGLGELSLLYYYWLIDNIKKSESKSLLIIEEPESFLPPLIQNRLCDVLAMTLATKGTACLISTHSEHVLRKIPRNHVHIMSRASGKTIFYNAAVNFEQMDVLGLTAPKKGVLFYEDEAAYLFVRSMVKASSSFVLDSFYYHCSVSEGGVLKDLERFPSGFSDFFFVAIFDGDGRERLNDKLKSFKGYLFLPSRCSPEENIISYLKEVDVTGLAESIGKPVAALNAATDVATGLDHHDYFLQMAKVLSLSYQELFSRLCDLWVFDEANRDEVNDFLNDLERMVK